MSTSSQNYEAQRRATRVRLEIKLVLSSLDPSKPFSGPCQTLVVNPQGCGLRCPRAVEPGTLVQLEKLPGGLSARGKVANCLPIGADGKFWLVGIALDEPANVWGISNPPEDWGAAKAHAESAAAGVTTVKKDKEWPFSQFSRRGEFHPGRR